MLKSIVYKGRGKIAIPNHGEFKPGEAVEVTEEEGEFLINNIPGFEWYNERKSTFKRSRRKTTIEEINHANE